MRRAALCCAAFGLVLLAAPAGVVGQAMGSIIGRVVDGATGRPLEAVLLELAGTQQQAVSAAGGRFVLGAVQPGERALRVEHLGYRPKQIEGIVVRSGRSTEIRVELEVSPVALQGVTVQVERVRLIEPDVSASHDIILGRELRALPVDRIDQVLELAPGVSGGHFRGGRVGQEVHVVDGIELKNQFEASREGRGFELSPTSLEEVEVITGGFGAQYGSALSGVVSYVTRRGDPDRWRASVAALSDEWAPEAAFRGFSGISANAGGPVRWLGSGTTMFADILAQGMLDAEPRVKGLTCLREQDAVDGLADEIRTLQAEAPWLLCPHTQMVLPHQRGDKMIAFARLHRPLSPNVNFDASLLRNRTQLELYTPEFRYSSDAQLGQRTVGTMATATLSMAQHTGDRVISSSARVAAMRLDRYLGVVDPVSFDGARPGRFSPRSFRFYGEDYTRSPIERQILAPAPVPGYVPPDSASADSPFGIAGTGIFFTGGTPHLANWATSDLFTADVVGEVLGISGSYIRSGASGRLFRIESYERTHAWAAGSAPNYARFFPASASAFTEGRISITDEMTINAGVRVDGFRNGIRFRADRNNLVAPVLDASWKISVNPRFGVAMPVPGSDGRAALRFNYGYVAQPPDFRYFLDTTLGDSLRTDVRRQGNPEMSFERGKTYEVGTSTMFATHAAISVVLFRKELSHLASGSMRIGETGDMLFSTDDEGTVRGAEISVRGRWSAFSFRGSYALQKATGVASGTDSDSLVAGDQRFVEYPLAFDRRHSMDVAVFYGRAAGVESAWAVALTSNLRSGYPIDRFEAADPTAPRAYLPWTSTLDLRVTRDLGRLPGCGTCTWRATFDSRNLLGRENIIAVRRETTRIAPAMQAVRALADAHPVPQAIPAESILYHRSLDINGDGVITPAEFRLARTAAAISRFDPSLYFGEPRQLRLGLEVAF